MAYDAATGTVVLFGGRASDGLVFNDTWVWDGATWTKQFPEDESARPGGRVDGL